MAYAYIFPFMVTPKIKQTQDTSLHALPAIARPLSRFNHALIFRYTKLATKPPPTFSHGTIYDLPFQWSYNALLTGRSPIEEATAYGARAAIPDSC